MADEMVGGICETIVLDRYHWRLGDGDGGCEVGGFCLILVWGWGLGGGYCGWMGVKFGGWGGYDTTWSR